MSVFFIRNGNTRPYLRRTLSRGSSVVDLSSATSVVFRMRNISDSSLTTEAPASIVDAVNGVVEYAWVPQDTASAGTFYGEWLVTWNDTTTETFPTVAMDVIMVTSNVEGSA